ncbi:MAG: DUF4126 domain-containing protein [Gordonia sp. (in: high G+C Gram-positive bacteria)]|uniref:DUF4126 domain-containing protein n=1 Tax=Gordonia sp. (in: high G+C Gram-positive bacteria) TaxID=84139 RepID=UPI0039E3E3CD
MIELLTGSGLAMSAGLNAYIPLLILGLAGRFLDFVHLPHAAQWLTNGWVLLILGGLLLVEVVADKVPVVDTVNDAIQTFVRPASGGIAFGTGAASQTAVVSDPGQFFTKEGWVTVILGILTALTVHGGKAAIRPAADASSAGFAAPVLSTVEDIGSVAMSIAALLAPILIVIALLILVLGMYYGWRGYRGIKDRRDRLRQRWGSKPADDPPPP